VATQGRQQRDGLREDAERHADPHDGDLGVGDGAGAEQGRAGHDQEDQAGGDDHDVVQDRCPHRWSKAALGVEVGAHDRAEAVEQHLGQKEAGEQHGKGARGGVGAGRGVEVDDLRGEQHQQQRGPAETDQRGAEQPLGVNRALLLAVPRGPHHQRHDDAGEDAAEQQVVDDVRRGVGHVERVRDPQNSKDRREHRCPQEAGRPGCHRPHGHRPGGGEQGHGAGSAAAPRRIARRTMRTPAATSNIPAPMPVTASASRTACKPARPRSGPTRTAGTHEPTR